MAEPVRSMTGIGSQVVESEAGRFEVEARSVNHRFLKTNVRHHGAMPNPEGAVESQVRECIQRGHVSVTIRYRPPAGAALALRVDPAAFAAAAAWLGTLATDAGLATPTTSDVLQVAAGMGEGPRAWDEELHGAALTSAVKGALDNLIISRETEGARMGAELARVLALVRGHIKGLAARAHEVPQAIRQRLETRLSELLEGTGTAVDPQWLAREVTVMADRGDVTEELARLDAHVAQFEELLAGGGVLGRRLDFLVQEFHRETSTVGSKANDLDLARIVMDLKTEVERLREQVQNLE